MKPHISYSNLNLSNQKSGNDIPSHKIKENLKQHSFQNSQNNSAAKMLKQMNRNDFASFDYGGSLVFEKSREVSPEINRQTQIDQLLTEINKTALQMSKKRSLDDLSLMDQLNGFDIVVAEKRPRTDLANHVYRLILRNEREKQYSSIQDLSTEIKALKQFEKEEEEKTKVVTQRVLREQDKNTLNTTMFDFQGSFGEEESNQFFAQMNKENLKDKLRQKHNFPKFSLDKVLEMQKMESFQQRCNKLQKIEGQKKPKHNFKQNEQSANHLRTETPNFLNQDLDIVASKRSPNHYQQMPIDQSQLQNPNRLNLPKLNFSELLNSSPNNSQKQRSQSVIPNQIHNSSYGNPYVNFANPKRDNSQFERAIDSHRNVAFAYYTRRLLLTAWRSLFNYHLDTENKALCRQLADQKYQKNAKRRVFKGFHQQAKQHYGHGRDNKRAVALFQLRMTTKYLSRWRQETHDQAIERQKLLILQEHLKNVRKRQYFEKLRQAILKQQMRAVQDRTALHISRQKRLRKVLLTFKYLVKFRRNLENEHQMTRMQNRQRLLKKGVKGLIKYRIGSLKYRQDLDAASQVRSFNLLKLALKCMKEYNLKRLQFKSLLHYAYNYYKSEKMKQSFECLHKYTQLMKGVNRQKFFIDTYYQKKLKFNLFQYLMATNMIFMEKEENLILMKQRQRKRKVLSALAKYRKEHRVHRQPKAVSFFFAAYLWLQLSFDKLVEESEKIPRSVLEFNRFMQKNKVNYYKNLSKKASQKLRNYYLQKIIAVWKERTTKLREFVNKREAKVKFNILRTLRIKSHKNGKYKFLLNKWLQNKNQTLVERIFIQLSKYSSKRKMARMIVQKMNEVKESKKVEKIFNSFKLNAKRKIFRRNQDTIAADLYQQNTLAKPYKLWRTRFLKISQRSDQKRNYLKFLRQKLLRKYFGKMHIEFWKINTKYDRQAKFFKEQRRKTIKKVMCGLLQNILLNHEKRNKLQIALGYLKNNLLIKSVKSWQFMMPELRQKSRLYNLVVRDKQLKTMAACFNSLRMYNSFKINQRAVDHFMTHSIRLITQKRFFKSWTSSLNRKASLNLLSKVFTEHRKKDFFTRVLNKRVFEDQVLSHMKLFKEFKLLEFTMMRGLKRNVDRRIEWLDIWDQVQVNRVKFSKLHFFRRWKQEKTNIDREQKMVHFTIVQIKNQIVRKYFQVLKDRMTIKEQFKAIRKQKRREVLRNSIELWINEITELNLLRNFLQRKQQCMRVKVLYQWRVLVDKNKQDRMKILTCFQISNYHRARLYLRMLYQNKEKQILQRQLYQNLQRLMCENLLRSVLNSARDYLSQNRETIQKMQYIRRKVNHRVLRSRLAQWQAECNETLTKLRVLKCLGALNRNIEVRSYLMRWVDYAQEGQEIEERGEYHLALRIQTQKQDALRMLKQNQERKVICRNRMSTVEAYWTKKTQLRFLTYMRCAVRILNRRRDNKVRAYQFLRSQLQKKALISFALQTQKNANFKSLQLEFNRGQRMIKAPQVFQKLRNFTYAAKERKIKSQFAFAFMSNKLYSLSFKALLMHFLYRRDQRIRKSKAVFQRCEILLRSTFETLKSHTVAKKIHLEKRKYLAQVISVLDQTSNLRIAYQGLKAQWELTKDGILQIRGLIALNQMRKVFFSIKSLTQKKNQLSMIGLKIQKKSSQKETRMIMHRWMRALGNEANVKVMERNRVKLLKKKAFDGFRRKYLIRRLQFKNLNSKAQSYTRICLTALLNNAQRQKKLRNAQSDLLFTNMQRMLARSFMSLRFQTLVIKNQRVLQVKRDKMLAIKAFSGWKYQSILDKTYTSYTTIKYKERLSLHFTNWFNLYKYNTTQKGLLSTLLFKKDSSVKQGAFDKWKKEAYRGRFLDLLQVNLTFPHQRYIAGRCIQNWSRYTRLQSQKQELMDQCAAMRSSLLARRVLREWYTQVQPTLSARVLGQRLDRSVNRLLKVKAFYLISVQGIRNEYIQENLTEIVCKKENEVKREFFNKWRRQYAILVLQRVVELKNRRKVMKNCLLALRLNAEESEIEKQQFTSLGDFVRSVSPHTQISLMRVFGDKGSRLQREELLRQYFLRFKIGIKNMKKISILKRQAHQYYRVRAQQKYFLQMVQTFLARHKERTYNEQGYEFWRIQTLKKALWAFVDNTLKQRKLNHARAYFEHKLAQQAIQGLKQEVQLAKKKSQLNTRMMYFLKKKCILIFKLSFTQWRVKFEHRHYGKTAVNEYNNFRNNKLKRMAFDYFVAIIHQRLQIKDMTSKAQNYFYKKEQLKILHKCFYALRDHSLTHKHEKEQHSQSEMTALKFYAFNLLTTHLKAWKREVRMTRNRQKRSKMYSLFSAWKFYTKERVLLKKYLQECSQVPSEASGLQASKPRQRSKGGERSGSNRPGVRGNSKGSEQNENQYVNGEGYLSARSNCQNNYNTKKTQATRLDPNFMTTQEMRDKVARFSNIKSDFVDGVSQEGTPFVTAQDRKILGSNYNVLNSASPSPMTRVGFSAGENRRIENSAGGVTMSGGLQNFNLSNLNRLSNGTYTGFNHSGKGQMNYQYQDFGAPAFGLASQGDMVNIGVEGSGQAGSNYNSALHSASGKSPLQNQRVTPGTNAGAYSSGGDRQMSRKYM